MKLSILELLDGVIRKPSTTLNLIARERPVGWALIIFIISALLGLISTDYTVLEEFIPSKTGFVIFSLIGSLAGLFILSGLFHLLSRIFNGSGDYWGLFSALGLSQFPGFLTPIAAVIKSGGGLLGAVFGGIISFASVIWVLVLYIIALRESHGLTTGTSIFTHILSVVIFVVVVLFGIFCSALFMRGHF